MENLHAAMLLNMVPGIGPRLYQKLCDRFGSPEAVFRTARNQLEGIAGIGPKLAQGILDAPDQIDVQQELDDCLRNNFSLLTLDDDNYPTELSHISNPPPVLYQYGNLQPSDRMAIAIVGSRHLTTYGEKITRQLARGLARAGVTIVSGLARGIDSIAHQVALESGGRTIAVLGSGLLNLYPPEHRPLMEQIAVNGAVISELPLHRAPHAGAFPQRNRIVSGLTLGTVVVEAGSRSGALITARHAMEQGREVFAVPGRVDQRNSHGCHQLIRDGAKLVQCVDDILEELGPLSEPIDLGIADSRAIGTVGPLHPKVTADRQHASVSIRQPAELQLTEQEQKILRSIDLEPTYVDTIVHRTEIPVHRVLATISVLQARRLVRRISGNQIARL